MAGWCPGDGDCPINPVDATDVASRSSHPRQWAGPARGACCSVGLDSAQSVRRRLSSGRARTARDRSRQPASSAIGRYRVLRVLGEGGMGAVYEAEQDNPRRTVALKVIRPGLAPELAAALRARGADPRPAAAPRHRAVYEAGTADGRAEPSSRWSSSAACRSTQYAASSALDARQRLELLARVCDAVQHAHSAASSTATSSRPTSWSTRPGQPKVLDFGVARVDRRGPAGRRSQTDVGQLIGTLQLHEPRAGLGDPPAIDTRSDVYALGVILLRAAGRPAALRPGEAPLPEAVRRDPRGGAARLGSLDRRCRGDVETIVAKALEKDKARRYASAAELAADIRRHLSRRADPGAAADGCYQLRKFARRNRRWWPAWRRCSSCWWSL